MMELYEMRYITVVAEYGNISKAAQKLFISQPSLSHSIAKVEKEIGVQLFDRSSHPLRPTYAGEKCIEMAYRILREERRFHKLCADISQGKSGRIHIGIPRERAASILPAVLVSFHQKMPNVELKFYSHSIDAIYEDVEREKLDFCIMPRIGDEKHALFHYEPLYDEELVLVASKGYLPSEFIRDNCLVNIVEVFAKYPLITQVPTAFARVAIDRFLKNNRLIPKIAMELSGNALPYLLAASGSGIAVIPRQTMELTVCPYETDIVSLLPDGVGWQVCAIFHQGAFISRAEQIFIRTVREIFANKGKQKMTLISD
jgi:DNA-binding transcriptional LysR family regulator